MRPLLLRHCHRTLNRGRQFAQSRSISIFRKYRGPTVSQLSGRGMNSADGPLVWIDCEMTGLDFHTDRLLEIAVIITNRDLKPVDEGINYVIKTEKHILDGMNPWCIRQHGESGLTQACYESPFSMEDVSQCVLQYVKKWVPTSKIGVLAGNSVHVDKLFLAEAMPELIDWLHYRIVDVSSIKELSSRWYGLYGVAPKEGESTHRALDDIRSSIKELQWYRENIFVLPPHEKASVGSDPSEGED